MQARRRDQIRDFAERIRIALDLEPPIDIKLAVGRLDGKIDLIENPVSDFDAMIEKIDGGFMITMSRHLSPARQKFTLAHEVGHLFLHMGYIIDPTKWDAITDYQDSIKYRHGCSEEEIEANEFAGTLLMPEQEFMKVAGDHLRDGRYHLKDIAQHFEVSVQAAKTRGRFLGLFSWN